MDNNIAIKVQNLTKIYHLYDKPQDRLKEALNPFKKSYHHDFYAMNDISFEIKKGETVGIIGKNGAGKSTLLKMITGVLSPTSGKISVDGKISSLLELGAGFNPEMTGMENIYLNGTLIGLTKEETDSKVDAILEFADIGEFIYQQVKTYSSGMFARLAFAIAINVDPDILIIDEALSVGDMRFQQKCYRKFREFQELKKTILFVSHETSIIINYCTHAIWINDGIKLKEGTPELVGREYLSEMAYKQLSSISDTTNKFDNQDVNDKINWVSAEGVDSFGERKAIINKIALVDRSNLNQTILQGGEDLTLKMEIYSKEKLINLIIGFIVFDDLGNQIFGSNTYIHEYPPIKFDCNSNNYVDFSFNLPYLQNGNYSISPAIAEGTQAEHIQHHWVHNLIDFKIHSLEKSANSGLLIHNIKSKIKVNND